MPIQYLLVLGVLVIFVAFLRYRRSLMMSRLGGAVLFAVALLAILFPAATNNVARWLGVGRGADLMLYLASLFFLYVILMLFVRIRKLERDVTLLTRSLAELDLNRPVDSIDTHRNESEVEES